MTDVFWLEQTSTDAPAADDWLSTAELVRLSGMRFAKRRADWRLGRWTAKQAASAYLGLPAGPGSLARIEIHAAPGGAPDLFVDHDPAPAVISISHREGRAACAITRSSAMLGCDLEIVEPRSDAFAADYFAAPEQELLAQSSPADRLQHLSLLWSAKESVLKALRVGLRIDTRLVIVDPLLRAPASPADWRPLRATHDGVIFNGWWQQTGNVIRTMVAAPAPATPTYLSNVMVDSPEYL